MHWITYSGYTPLLTQPTPNSIKLCDLTFGARVESLDINLGQFVKVRYATAVKTFEGWIPIASAELLQDVLPAGVVDLGDMQTPNPQDAAQYVIYINQIQYNLCSELSICSIFEVGLGEFLDKWKASPTSWFNRIFQGGKGMVTGVPDLANMAIFYPCQVQTVKDALLDPYYNRIVLTPRRLSYWTTNKWQVVLGVKIETLRGELRATGTPHWIVVRDVEPTGVNRALVTYYNPFTNNVEQCSWHELLESAGSVPYGLMVRRFNSKESNEFSAQ